MQTADLERVNKEINQCAYVSEVGDDWSPITAEGGDCDRHPDCDSW
jgi:hypothetical protein